MPKNGCTLQLSDVKSRLNYSKKDRATGANAEIAKEKRKQWNNSNNENYETIDGIDQLLS